METFTIDFNNKLINLDHENIFKVQVYSSNHVTINFKNGKLCGTFRRLIDPFRQRLKNKTVAFNFVNIDCSLITDTSYAFSDLNGSINGLDISNVIDCSYMFQNSSFRFKFNAKNIKLANGTFMNANISNIDISELDIKELISIKNIFQNAIGKLNLDNCKCLPFYYNDFEWIYNGYNISEYDDLSRFLESKSYLNWNNIDMFIFMFYYQKNDKESYIQFILDKLFLYCMDKYDYFQKVMSDFSIDYIKNNYKNNDDFIDELELFTMLLKECIYLRITIDEFKEAYNKFSNGLNSL